MRRRVHWGVCAAVLSLAGCKSDPSGLHIEVTNLGTFAAQLATLKVTVSAPKGFMMPVQSGTNGVTLSTEADPSGQQALVVTFAQPPFQFGSALSFIVATANDVDLTVNAAAVGYDADGNTKTGADGQAVTLPAGGSATVVLALAPRMDQTNSQTRTTDLQGESSDVTVKGGVQDGHLTSLAVCDVDGDGADDLIIGAPDVDANSLTGAGALYVVFGGVDAGTTVDLSTAPTFHFYGQSSGDHLGTAVACAHVDNATYADIVVSAPGSVSPTGHVYVVFGGTNIRTSRTIQLGAAGSLPDIELQAPSATKFGDTLYARDLDGDGHAEILVGAPGEGKVHLFTGLAASPTPVDTTASPHVTFSGLSMAGSFALSAGDFNGDTAGAGAPLDLVIGDANYRASNEQTARGAIYGYAALVPTGATQYDVTPADPAGPSITLVGPAQGAQFGAAVLAFDSGDGDDLLVGAPGSGTGGAVFVYDNSSVFFAAPMPSLSPDVTLAAPLVSSRFGTALAAIVTGASGSGGARLAVGAPNAAPSSDRAGAGAAYVYGGLANRSFPLLEQMFGAAAGDGLGAAVAGGQISMGDAIGDLAAAAPNATGAAARAGVVYVRYGR